MCERGRKKSTVVFKTSNRSFIVKSRWWKMKKRKKENKSLGQAAAVGGIFCEALHIDTHHPLSIQYLNVWNAIVTGTRRAIAAAVKRGWWTCDMSFIVSIRSRRRWVQWAQRINSQGLIDSFATASSPYRYRVATAYIFFLFLLHNPTTNTHTQIDKFCCSYTFIEKAHMLVNFHPHSLVDTETPLESL